MRTSLHNCFILFLLFILNGCITRPYYSRSPVQLEQAWASEPVFLTPESALYDPARNIIYVSNINKSAGMQKDGDGFISRLNPNGEIEELRWVTGLNDPKGIALYNNVLYVADVDEIVAVSTQSGEVLGNYKAQNATDLKGITVDENGLVFVTDTEQQRIYLLDDGQLTTWIDNTLGEKPNGIFKEGTRMIVAFPNTGKVRFLDPETKNFTDWTDGINSADGIAETGDNFYLVSSWDGEVFYVNSGGKKWSILNTKNQNINTADINYAERLDLLLVPTFNDNRVIAYRVRER